MGVRIDFYTTSDSSTLKNLIFQEYPKFREWMLNIENEFPQEFSPRLIDLIQNNQSINIEFLNKKNQGLIDQLVCEFLISYCESDEKNKKLIKNHGPSIHPMRYKNDLSIIAEVFDKEILNLIQFLFNGRSLKDGKTYFDPENEYKVGYWTKSEQNLLLDRFTEYYENAKLKAENIGTLSIIETLKNTSKLDNELLFTNG